MVFRILNFDASDGLKKIRKADHIVQLLKSEKMEIKDNHINYVEFKAKDLEKIKAFYTASFAWTFTDYGPTYIAFSESGLQGGFEKTEAEIVNGALVILYHKNLDLIKSKIIESSGKISKDTYSFPGGHRFHFIDPAGNELAVWSDK
jgi:hypothetical protein